jgi:hypothetical protein
VEDDCVEGGGGSAAAAGMFEPAWQRAEIGQFCMKKKNREVIIA